MAVVIGGAGLGNYDVLGQAGIKLSGSNGLRVNASTGNLVVSGSDQSMVSRGLDLSLARTYNSQGMRNDHDGDNWRFSFEREVRVVGDKLQRTTGDGHVATFIKQKDGSYLSVAGAGAHDSLKRIGSEWVYTEGSTGVKEYYRASDGRMQRTEDKHGNRIDYRYNGNRLAAVSNASGEELRFNYNSKGQLSRVDSYTQVGGNLTHSHSKVHYSYDTKGRLHQVKVDLSPEDKSISDGKVFTTTYTYQDASSHLLKSIEKSNGSKVTLGYQMVDGKARLSRIDDNSVVTQLNYQANRGNGHQLKVTDSQGEVWHYKHDSEGRLVSVLSPDVNYDNGVNNLPRGTGQSRGEVTYQYDDNDNLIVVRDGSGKEIKNQYDANGNLLEIWRNGELHLKHEYENNLLVASHSYANGQKEASAFYVYENGKLRFEISQNGNTTEHSYNGFGQRVSMRRYTQGAYGAGGRPSVAEMVSWTGKQDKQQTELTEYSYQRGELHTQTTYSRLDANGRGDTVKDLKISSVGMNDVQWGKVKRGVTIGSSHIGGNGRGVTVTLVNSLNGLVSNRTFDTYGKAEASHQLVAYLNEVKANVNGAKIILTTSDEWVKQLNQEAKNALIALGVIENHLIAPEVRSSLLAVVEKNGTTWTTIHQQYKPRYSDSSPNYKLTNAEHIRTTYDAFGNLLGTETLTGDLKSGRVEIKSSSSQIFDGLNRVTSQTDAAGRTTSTQFLDASRQVLVTSAGGQITRRTFSQRGELLTESTSAKGEVSREQTHLYNTSGQLVATRLGNGAVSTQFYDEAGNLWLTVSASGQVTEYQRDGQGRVVREMQYDSKLNPAAWLSNGKLSVSGRDVLGKVDPGAGHRVTNTEYDALGRIFKVTNGEGLITEYRYDNQDRQTQVRHYTEGYHNEARVLTNHYDKAGQLAMQQDASGYVKRYFYDSAGKLTETRTYKEAGNTKPSGEYDSDRVIYDSRGRQQYVLDKQGYLTETRYLDGGREKVTYRYANVVTSRNADIASIRRQAGSPQQIARERFNSAGQLMSAVDRHGIETRYHYNEATGLLRQQVTAANTSDSRSVYLSYNGYGEQTGRVSAAGSQDWKLATINTLMTQRGSRSAYNAMGWKESDYHPATGKTEYRYDKAGRQLSETDAQGRTKSTSYTAFGDVKQRSVAGVVKAEYHYDKAGRLSREIDGEQAETAYIYNRQGKVAYNVRQQVSDAHQAFQPATGSLIERQVTHYRYDARGNVIAMNTAKDYRAGSRLSGGAGEADVTASSLRYKAQWSRKYDHLGRVVSESDGAGRERVTDYLHGGRIKTVKLSGALQERIELDALGRTLTIANGKGEATRYEYDDTRRTVTVVSPGGIRTVTEKNAHGEAVSITDGLGHRRKLHYNHNGVVVKTEFQAAGSTAVTALSSKEYDSNTGLLRFSTDGEGTRTEYRYTAAGQQWKVIRDADGDKLQTEYGYDQQGQRIWEDTEGRRTYIRYDNNGHKIRVEQGGVATTYQYDSEGRVIRTVEGAVHSASRVQEERVTEYRYDTGGNLTGKRIRSGADWAGTASSQTTLYRYDGAGQVVEKATGVGATTRYVYDSYGRVKYEINALNYVTKFAYDAANRVTHTTRFSRAVAHQANWTEATVTAAIGAAAATDRTTETRYDKDGRAVLSIDAQGYATGYEYDANGQVISTTRYHKPTSQKGWQSASASNRVSQSVYDGLGRLQYTIDTQGRVKERGYDNEGRITHTISYETDFTLADRSAASLGALKTHLSTEVQAGRIRAELSVYDQLGRLRFALDGDGFLVEFQYNRQSLKIRKKEFVDNQAVLKALNDVRSGQAAMTEYAVFLRLTESLQNLDDASAELRAQLAELNHQQGRINGLFSELSVLEREIASTNNANHDLGVSIGNANNRLAGLQKEVETEQARHADLQKKINALSQEIAEHEATLKGQNRDDVAAAQSVLDVAKKVLNAAKSDKGQTAAAVRAQVKDSDLTALHPEWKNDFSSRNGKIWKSVDSEAAGNAALALVGQRRAQIEKEKASYQQQYAAALAGNNPTGLSTAELKKRLDKAVNALAYLESLYADIQSDISARERIQTRTTDVRSAEQSLADARAKQQATNNNINGTPSAPAINHSEPLTLPAVPTGDQVPALAPPAGSLSAVQDKIDGLKSRLQVLAADIDTQTSTVELKTAALAQREKEYQTAKSIYDAAQAERKADIAAAKKAADAAQKVRNAAWTEHQAALASKNTHTANQKAKQTSYNKAKGIHDTALKARNSAQTASNNASTALSSANKSRDAKLSSRNKAQSDYNHWNTQYVNANNHYNYTVGKVNTATSHLHNARKHLNHAQAAYNRAVAGRHTNEEGHSWGTSISQINSKRAARDRAATNVRNNQNSYHYWVGQRNSATNDRKAKLDKRNHCLNVLNAAKGQYNTSVTQANAAKTHADKAASTLASANKALDATKAPLTNATKARNSANSALSGANTRFAQADKALKSADAVLAARQRKYEDAKGTPQEQVDIAQARFDTAKTEKAAAEKALVDARSLHDRLFSQSSNLRKSVDQAQARFDVVNRNYQQKTKDYNNAQNTYNNAEADKRNKAIALTNTQSNLTSLSRDLESAKHRYDKAVPEVNGVKSQLDSARSHLRNAQSAYDRAVAGRHTNEEGNSWGTSQSEINNKRGARDRAATDVRNKENAYNTWVAKRNTAAGDMNRLEVSKKTAKTAVTAATDQYNAALIAMNNARDALNTLTPQYESLTAQYNAAKTALDTQTSSLQQVEARLSQAKTQIETAEKRLADANTVHDAAKETLALLGSDAAGDAATVQYEKETKQALIAARQEKLSAINTLNTLKAESDNVLTELAALLKPSANGGKDVSHLLVDETIGSLDQAKAAKEQAEKDMVVNQQKVTTLRSQLSTLADSIDQQSQRFEEQKRDYEEKLAVHATKRDAVRDVSNQLKGEQGVRVSTEAEIISWENAKRVRASSITAAEMGVAQSTLAHANASDNLTSANALLSTNKAVQTQRKEGREAAKKDLEEANSLLGTARGIKRNAASSVRDYIQKENKAWDDGVWIAQQDVNLWNSHLAHQNNNKFRTLSEEQGGGTTGHTNAQINATRHNRDLAANFLHGFKNQFKGIVHSGPNNASTAEGAMRQIAHYEAGFERLLEEARSDLRTALKGLHSHEEGRGPSTFTQAQVNAAVAKRNRAQQGLSYVTNLKTKMTDDKAARDNVNALQATVNRLTSSLVTAETHLANADTKVTQAERKVKKAQSSLNSAQSSLAAAKQNVSSAHTAMDEAEKNLNSARARMNSVEGSIGHIRKLLDIAKTDESKAEVVVVAARKELNVAQGNLNVAKNELNTTVSFLNEANNDLQEATILHRKVNAYLDRANIYKERAGKTVSDARQIFYLAAKGLSQKVDAGAVSNDTDYRYDVRGQLTSTLSATVSYAEVSSDRNVLQNIGRLNTTHSYDSLGNVVSTTTAAGTSMANTQRFEFSVMGKQTKSQGLAGSSVIYNDQNLATVNINAENYRRDKVYDQQGQLRFDVDELGHVTEHRYNAYGEKVAQVRFSNVYTATRPSGQGIALADMVSFAKGGGSSRTLSWNYDKRGQQTATVQGSSLNGTTISDKVTFNAFGEKVSTIRNYVNVDHKTSEHLYSVTGELLATRDAEGYVTLLGYNHYGEVSDKKEFSSRYNGSWNLVELSKWANGQSSKQRLETYQYDKRGNRQQTTRHDADFDAHSGNTASRKNDDIITTTYHDYAGRLYLTVQETGTVNKSTHFTTGNRVLHEYDALGRLVSSWGKERQSVVSNVSLAVKGKHPVRSPSHQRTDYLFDAQGNQISINTEGRSTFQYFNASGQLTGRKDAEGNYTQIVTDKMNRVVRESQHISSTGALNDSLDKVTTYSYDKTGRQTGTTQNSSSGKITESAHFNAFGEVTEKRHNNKVQETFVYDGFGQVSEATRKETKTEYLYNWLGKVTREAVNGSRVTTREYDKLGNVTKEIGQAVDGKTPVTSQTFDRWGNVQTRNVNGSVYRFEYNSSNQVFKQTAPQVDVVDINGKITKRTPVTLMYYDQHGNRIATQAANGSWQKSYYDLSGQKLMDVNGVGGKTHYYHDARGDMVGRINTQGQGEMFSYNENGQLLTRAKLNLDKNYAEVYAKYAYDQAGQRYSEEWVGETGYTQWTRFDAAGRVLETQGNGKHQTFSYDSFGNKTREAWIENGIEKASKSATYNHYGRLATETLLDGNKTTYSYNSSNQVTRKHGSGIDLRFEYHANGLLKKQWVGSKSETYRYDINGKEVSRTLKEGNNQLTTVSNWDSHGRLSAIKTTVATGFGKTLDSAEVKYQYDQVGNRRKVISTKGNTSQARWYRYDGDNRMVGSHTNATDSAKFAKTAGSRVIAYDAAGRKYQEIKWKSHEVKNESLFSYDVNGHIKSIETYQHQDGKTYQTRFLTQKNSRSGYALSQQEMTTTFQYTADRIQANSGKTTDTVTTFTYADGQMESQSVRESGRDKFEISFTYHYSGQISKQFTNVISQRYTDTLVYNYQGRDGFQKKQTIASSSRNNFEKGITDFHYNPAGQLTKVTSTKAESRREVLTDFNGQVALQLSGGKLSAELSVGGNPLARLSETKLDADLLSDSAASAGTQPGAYTVKASDTLQRISQMVYGDSRYWYLIADANGLSPSESLTTGKSLVIPNQHTQTYNGAESFKPYNESEVLGNINPDPIAPPPPKKSCNPIAMIIMVVVAVVVTVYTAGAAAGVMGGVVGGSTGTMAAGAAVLGGAATVSGGVAGTLAAAAIGGAVGSAASQLVGKAMGVVDEFSWEQVALGGLASAATAGMGATNIAGSIAGKGNHFGQGMVRSATSYATNYVGSKALGQDVSFSWRNLASSALGGGISSGLASGLPTENIISDTLTGFAGAAASSALRGESFGDNADQMLTDAFGNALGNVATREVQAQHRRNLVGQMDDHQRLQALKDGQMAVDRAAYDQYQDHRRNVGIMDRVGEQNSVRDRQMEVDRASYDAINERRRNAELMDRVLNSNRSAKGGFNFKAESMRLRATLDLVKHQARLRENAEYYDNGMRLEPAFNASQANRVDVPSILSHTLGAAGRFSDISQKAGTITTRSADLFEAYDAYGQQVNAYSRNASANSKSAWKVWGKLPEVSTRITTDLKISSIYEAPGGSEMIRIYGENVTSSSSAGLLSDSSKGFKFTNYLGKAGDVIEFGSDMYNNFSQDGVSSRAFIGTMIDGGQMIASGWLSTVAGAFVGTTAGAATTLTVAGVPAAPAVALTTGAATGVYVDSQLDGLYNTYRDDIIDGADAAYNWVSDLFD